MLRVHFDTAKVTVEALTTGAWKPLSSGSEIVDNTQLRLTAIGLPADSTVQSWTVGKTNIPAEGHELTYTVRKADANDNNIVTIYYTERKIVNLKINFDAAQVKVEAEQAGTWNTLTSGSTVQENTRLRLTALAVPAGTPVQAWKVGNTIVPAEGSELIHTVRKVDADSSNRVALAYTVKSDKLIIAFDKEKVKVFTNESGIVRDGSELTVGMKLNIATQNLPTGEIVDTWKIGKRNISADSNDCKYTVMAEDAESGIIAISYTTKAAKKFTLNFDGSKITVRERKEDGPWQILSSGTQVEERTRISIKATDIPVGHIVDMWTIGKRTFPTEHKDECWSTVKSADAESGVITISYTTKPAQKFTLTFDAAKMTVTIPQQHGQDQTLSNGAQVEEGTEVRIEAKNLPAGQIVDTWKIGKRTFEDKAEWNGNRWGFHVGSNYAEGDTISISYTTKAAKKFTLTFDESKMTVEIPQQHGQAQTLSKGAEVEEMTGIIIEAKDLPIGQIVNTWEIGKRTFEDEGNWGGNRHWFCVSPDYAESGVITISYTTKATQKFTLSFNEAKMTVRIWQQYGQGQTLSNDAEVKERTEINIEAKDLPVGKIVDEWKIGKRTFEDDKGSNRCWIRVDSDYAEGGTITISYTTKNE
ncbi:hypothetical protein ABK01_06065 [Treponema sp. OMZ 305]|uniref:hypothetical protein n=1 Tax=Treponema sp. OMZ 305 TaxID=1659192 RepID=UPI0020A25FAB|nr:hypothetical protein [Treponema sp. OMZ 305]UTC57866.1 hypothetical protein ABK01_06065 [Treponema sp. OMZ 305]